MLTQLLIPAQAHIIWIGVSVEQSARSFTTLKDYVALAARPLDVFVYTWTSESLLTTQSAWFYAREAICSFESLSKPKARTRNARKYNAFAMRAPKCT